MIGHVKNSILIRAIPLMSSFTAVRDLKLKSVQCLLILHTHFHMEKDEEIRERQGGEKNFDATCQNVDILI